MRYTQTREQDSALKRKSVLSPATLRMNLEDVVLSEMSRSQEDKYCMTLLT